MFLVLGILKSPLGEVSSVGEFFFDVGGFVFDVGGFFGVLGWAATSFCSPSMHFLASIHMGVGNGKPLGRSGDGSSTAPL